MNGADTQPIWKYLKSHSEPPVEDIDWVSTVPPQTPCDSLWACRRTVYVGIGHGVRVLTGRISPSSSSNRMGRSSGSLPRQTTMVSYSSSRDTSSVPRLFARRKNVLSCGADNQADVEKAVEASV